MGTRGPVPRRSSERRRRNKDSRAAITVAAAADAEIAAHVTALLEGKARDVIERVERETTIAVLGAAASMERRVTVGRAIEARLAELMADSPELPPETHQIARDWYESLKVSGQVEFFEPSDWASARLVAAAITRILKDDDRLPGEAFKAVWSAMGDLLTTEGARRRARLEIEHRKPEEPAGQDELAAARERLQREG